MKEELELKHMGKGNSVAIFTDKFDSTLLDKIFRNFSRKVWNITGNEFIGYDVWHCHEATFLLESGSPIAGTLKIIYPSSSNFIVESKSLKLFTNSFDNCKMGRTIEEATFNYQIQIKEDLEKLLECKVQVQFFKQNANPGINDFRDYQSIESLIDIERVVVNDYHSVKSHLKFTEEQGDFTYKLTTNVLRSRCEKSGQKDTGTAFFYIKSTQQLDLDSLFREVVSLRDVEKFHEPCAERLFTSLRKFDCVKECCVSLLYSRRGSWDINPVRSTSLEIMPQSLTFIGDLTYKQQGQ